MSRPPGSTFGSSPFSPNGHAPRKPAPIALVPPPAFVETSEQTVVSRQELWQVVDAARLALRRLSNGRRGTAEIDAAQEALERALGRL